MNDAVGIEEPVLHSAAIMFGFVGKWNRISTIGV